MKRLKLTVCYINSYLMAHTGQSPTYRTKTIELTPAQSAALMPREIAPGFTEDFDRVVLEYTQEDEHAAD